MTASALLLGSLLATLSEMPHHVTRGVTLVNATPAEVYALVTDYRHWPRVLSDITSVKLEAGGRDDARLRFHSRAIDHTVTVVFDNVPNHVIRFRGVDGPPGGRASGTYTLEPADGGAHTRVTADLYLDVVGLPSLFISDARLRSVRRAKLQADLGDVAHWFDVHPARVAG